MPLYDVLRSEEAEGAFILGMAKNAGKTFTLNHLVRAGSSRGETLGLTSTGRDGEPLDLVTGKAKPRIFCPKGTVVASARQAMELGTAELRDIEATGIDTVLGEVEIGVVEREGRVELAGPLFAEELRLVLERMRARGANRTLVDGSLDRKAAGRVVQSVILAVGAVVSRDMDEVVEKALAFTEQLTLPRAPPWVLEAVSGAKGAGALIGEDGSSEDLPFSTLMGRGAELRRLLLAERPWGLFVSGALGDETFSALADLETPRLVVRNASSLFVDSVDWRRFVRKGGLCYAAQPLRLLAVTVNPHSPEGWEFPAEDFLREVRKALAPLPVFNPANTRAS